MSPVHSSLYSGWFIIGYYEMYWHLCSPAGLLSERAVWHVGRMDYSRHRGVTLQTRALLSQHAVGQGAAYSSARPSGNWESSRRSAGHFLSFSLLPNASSHSLTVHSNPRFFLSLYLIFCSYFPFCPFFFSSLSLSLYFSSSIERVSVYAQTHHHCNDSIT